MKRILQILLIGLAMLGGAARAEVDDPARPAYYGSLKGKTLAFIPMSMGMDWTDGWAAMLRGELEPLGAKIVIRDANWKTDVGAQAITSLISEKPDAILIQNPDIQSYARLLRRAQEAGIHVIQVNMRTSTATDVFVGPDWVGVGEAKARAIVGACGKGSGKSGKVAIVQGVLTAAASMYMMNGINTVLSQNPDIKVISNQPADWDASKARSITETVLKQHPDLCGVIGFWDSMDLGTSAAIREANMQGKVHLVTDGSLAHTACDNVNNGAFSTYIGTDVRRESSDIASAFKWLMQAKPKAGEKSITLYTPVTVLTKASMHPASCWNLAHYKK